MSARTLLISAVYRDKFHEVFEESCRGRICGNDLMVSLTKGLAEAGVPFDVVEMPIGIVPRGHLVWYCQSSR